MTHLRRNWWKMIATLLAFTLISTACGDGGGNGDSATDTTAPPRGLIGGEDEEATDEGEGPVYGGRVTVGLEAETAQWLPGAANFVVPSGTSVAHAIYDPLVILNEDSEWEPYLAESLEPNDDLTEWTLTLREGVTFHDGTVLDAAALKWNFDTLHFVSTSNSFGSINAAGVVSMDIVDDMTVVYKLNAANAAFPDILRGSIGWPTSPTAYETLGRDTLGEQPVGTGPFVYNTWTRDDRFVMDRNPNYWREDADGNQLPYLDGIEFRPIADEDSRAQSLAADSVQIMTTLRGSTAKVVLDLVEERNYRANIFVGNQSGSSIFNTQVPPLDDIRVRSALVEASDAEAVAVVLGDDGLVPITTQFYGPNSGWYSEAAAAAYLGVDGPDPETASALIEEYVNDPTRSDGKAVGDPVTLEYACPPDPSLIEIGQLVQSLWGNIGVEVTLKQVEQAELVQNAISGEFVINCWRAGAGEGDPLTALQGFFGDPETNILNFTNFTDPEITELLVTLKTSADFSERYDASERINIIANENAIMTWSVATPTLVGWRDDIFGLTDWVLPSGNTGNGTPGGHMHFSQVYIRPS